MRELGIGAREEGLLVLFAAEGEERFFFVAGAQVLFCYGGFAGGYDGDFLLVLVQFVALVLEVEDCSGVEEVLVSGRYRIGE